MDSINEGIIAPLKDFSKNSVRLLRKCTKPDAKEYTKVCVRTALGFIVMGVIGFFVKLIFIVSNTTYQTYTCSSCSLNIHYTLI